MKTSIVFLLYRTVLKNSKHLILEIRYTPIVYTKTTSLDGLTIILYYSKISIDSILGIMISREE